MRPSKAARTEPIPDSESHHAQMRNQNGVEKADDDDDDDDGMCFSDMDSCQAAMEIGDSDSDD